MLHADVVNAVVSAVEVHANVIVVHSCIRCVMIVSEAASTLQVNSRKKFFLSLQFPFSLTLLKNFVISYLF